MPINNPHRPPRPYRLPFRLLILLLLVVIGLVILRENLKKRPRQLYQTVNGQVEMCLSCHQGERLDPAHDVTVLGCSSCHLGDPLATGKTAAHRGMVENPGDLRVVNRTCGVNGCHAIDVPKVKNSLMATNRGILATLLYYWKEAPNQYSDLTVEQLIKTGQTSLALDYFRKLCATCHLWKQKHDLPGFLAKKGGGCTACHHQKNPAPPPPGKKKSHPLITKKIPVENCVRCHNRSGRIGISYTGQYESEGSGAPIEHGQMSSHRLPGDRFALSLPPDVHFTKGLACIDCHTRNEVMGDGKRYAHFEEQLEISCTTCHTQGRPGITNKNHKLNNIDFKDSLPVLVSKLDGKRHPLNPPRPEACDYSGHQRLTCQACHSTWVPQCYGCHANRNQAETHLDKLTLKETPGWWSEGRSYIRYEQPALGLWNNRVMPVTPGCQDVVTLQGSKGQAEKAFYSFTMAAIDPHTTQAKGRGCADCHTATKSLGLGLGTVWKKGGSWHFEPASQPLETQAGETPRLDAFVTIDGVPLQKSFRPNLRPFNAKELSRILTVGTCLPCHPRLSDPAYHPYAPDKCRRPVGDQEANKGG
ncbi:MAG: hypothetical protein M0Z90_03240 [Desulfobacteraceae bacterium]|nr:hypothetical protein [Desulfobacteraceae bacterium]